MLTHYAKFLACHLHLMSQHFLFEVFENFLFSSYQLLSLTLFYIIYNLYQYFMNEKEYSKSDAFGFIILTALNLGLYKLINILRGSFFHYPLIDLLCINVAVLIGINFHWKFWFLYLAIPVYLLYIGFLKVYEHVKTVGKEDGTEELKPEPQNTKEKKVKYEKVKMK